MNSQETTRQVIVALKYAREWGGWTQGEMADFCGLSLSAVQKYEAGRTAPPLRVLHEWAFRCGGDFLIKADGGFFFEPDPALDEPEE